MENDPFEHMRDNHSAHHFDGPYPHATKKHVQKSTSLDQYANPKAVAQRPLSSSYFEGSHVANETEPSRELIDPTLGHVKRATIVVPVDMMLHYSNSELGLLSNDLDGVVAKGSDEHSSNDNQHGLTENATPTYSIKQSRLVLFAAFPPPPIIIQSSEISDKRLKQELNLAKQRLKRHSGFYGAFGIHSATHQDLGYVDTTLSLNYRCPKMLALPTRLSNAPMIGNVHCNLYLGANTKESLGVTLSSIDGRSNICLDAVNPFPRSLDHQSTKYSVLSPQLNRRCYTISFSRDISLRNGPFRVQGVLMFAPLPCSKLDRSQNMHATLLQQFAFVVTNSLDSYKHISVLDQSRNSHDKIRPKVSVSFGYGKNNTDWDQFLSSCDYRSDVEFSRDIEYQSTFSTFVKVDVKQQLSPSQTCHSSIKYRHLGQTLSLGTVVTRTFSSSPFSRLGVGVRHVFGNIWDWKAWKHVKTWWLLQLERGDVTFCIPIAIYPAAETTWESCIRLLYVSIASLIVDAIVGELLCDATSMLRVRFLQMLLGKDYLDMNCIADSICNVEMETHRNAKRFMALQLATARENALKQRDIMKKQAKKIAKKEEDNSGLVIVKAVYGVIDNENNQWVSQSISDNETSSPCTLDATVQLQFWVNDGKLRMPATSKKNMLGFYNVLDCINDEEWLSEPPCSSFEQSGILQKVSRWYKQLWDENPDTTYTKRQLRVVLSIRYKWENNLYDVMFYDDEAVQLPSTRSKEVKD